MAKRRTDEEQKIYEDRRKLLDEWFKQKAELVQNAPKEMSDQEKVNKLAELDEKIFNEKLTIQSMA
jgi:hypothetical protein